MKWLATLVPAMICAIATAILATNSLVTPVVVVNSSSGICSADSNLAVATLVAMIPVLTLATSVATMTPTAILATVAAILALAMTVLAMPVTPPVAKSLAVCSTNPGVM